MTDGHGHVGIGSNFIFLHFYKQMCQMRGGSDWETEEKLQDAKQAVDSHTPLYLTPIGPVSY